MVQRDWLEDWSRGITSFCSWYRKAARLLLTYLLTGRLTSLTLPYSPLPSYLTPFLPTLLYSFLLCYWDNSYLNSLATFFGQKYPVTNPNCVLAKFRSHLIENILRHFQIMSLPTSNCISSKIF